MSNNNYPVTYNNVSVITTKQIADEHGLQVKVVNQKFRRNKEYFKENIDFFIVTRDDLAGSQIATQDFFTQNNMKEVYFFSLSGYLKFVKTINDEKAWHIYTKLVKSYFNESGLNDVEQQFLIKTKENRNNLTSEWAKHQAENYRKLTINEYESLFNDKSKRKKNMDDKELSLLSAFEFLEQRKLENNPQIIGDTKLSNSILDTGNKVNNIVSAKVENREATK